MTLFYASSPTERPIASAAKRAVSMSPENLAALERQMDLYADPKKVPCRFTYEAEDGLRRVWAFDTDEDRLTFVRIYSGACAIPEPEL